VEQDGYPLIGQTTLNGYWIALGQDDSGNEELVETWPSALQAQEEFAQYHNALMLNGLNDVTLTTNGDLLIIDGPANEVQTIINQNGLSF